MKTLFALVAFTMLIPDPLRPDDGQAWGLEVEGYKLAIHTDKAAFNCGEPIKLGITLRNSSQEHGWVRFSGMPEIDYPATVLLPADWLPFRQQAPLTEEGLRRTNTRNRYVSNHGGPFYAGAERVAELDLNTLYDMRRSGEYDVTVSTKVRNRSGNGSSPIVSNNLKLTVGACKQ
ncbi:MAG: hypothetical protein JNL98_34370 [Bryobacterales bacterium]|nr:hypothetical protein [Bryobacterales bacterium]